MRSSTCAFILRETSQTPLCPRGRDEAVGLAQVPARIPVCLSRKIFTCNSEEDPGSAIQTSAGAPL